jgi:transposase
MEVATIGLDLAKNIFQVHGADASGGVAFRKPLRRDKVLTFFAGLPPCTVAMEACGGAHYWAREIGKAGHTVRLIPAAYVKPFVKRQKNDAADAEAICEAAQRPTMRFVAVKARTSRRAPSCSGPVICWFVNAPRRSTHCVAISPNTDTSWLRGRPMSPS